MCEIGGDGGVPKQLAAGTCGIFNLFPFPCRALSRVYFISQGLPSCLAISIGLFLGDFRDVAVVGLAEFSDVLHYLTGKRTRIITAHPVSPIG